MAKMSFECFLSSEVCHRDKSNSAILVYLLTYLLHLTVSVNCNIQFYYLLTSVGCKHRQNPLCQHTEGWLGWISLGGWFHSTTVYLHKGCHASHY